MTPTELLDQVKAAKASRQNEEAVDGIRRLLIDDAPLGKDWEQVMAWAIELADEDSSLECAKKLVAAFPRDPKAGLILAERFSRVGRSDYALQVVRRVAQTSAPNPAIDHFTGVYLGQLGDIKGATPHFRNALQKKPDFGDAWAMLSSVDALEEADVRPLEKLIDKPSSHSMPGAGYALGQFRDRQDDTKRAWKAWTAANTFERRKKAAQLGNQIAQMDLVRQGEGILPDGVGGASSTSFTPIFIVGPPRSGTSLIEEVISRSPNVSSLGETTLVRLATWSLGGFGPADFERAGVVSGDPGAWERMSGIYDALVRVRAPTAQFVTEKAVMLHLYVGVLARILPNAKFIWLQRDPKDVALSCYKAYLTDGNRWRHTIRNAAEYLTAHNDLMAFWAQKFPERVLPLSYESFVSDPETGMRHLRDFCGLSEPGAAASQPNAAPRSVTTASFAQVRGPITTKSVGSWHRYEKWIVPAFET